MLATYQNALFAVPENPVMRAVHAMEVMPRAGATLEPLQHGGMGCAVGVKPFGLGLVNDEGTRLYGDFYGSQQNGGMRLNGDPLPGLGADGFTLQGCVAGCQSQAMQVFRAAGLLTSSGAIPKRPHGVAAYYRPGMGGVEEFMSNVASGNVSAALGGNDFSASIPNIVVVLGVWWFISTLTGQVSRGKGRVRAVRTRLGKKIAGARGAPRGSKFEAAQSIA